jgi:y4mF family transcriptional regulator
MAREIGAAVRAERDRQGLKQEDLALAAGVSARTVVQIEQGKPTSRLDVLARVLAALGLSVHVLPARRALFGDQPMNSKFEIYADASGAFRWRLRAPNGEVVARSRESYASRREARRSASSLSAALARGEEDAVEIVRRKDGSYGWRMRTPTGQIAVTSEDSFKNRAAARHAADAVAAELEREHG